MEKEGWNGREGEGKEGRGGDSNPFSHMSGDRASIPSCLQTILGLMGGSANRQFREPCVAEA